MFQKKAIYPLAILAIVSLSFSVIAATLSDVLKKGEELTANGKFDEAVKLYSQALEGTKDKGEKEKWQKEIAEIYFTKLQNYASASEVYADLAELYPKSKDAALYCYRLGVSYEQLADFVKAGEAYQKVIMQYPKKKGYPAEIESLASDGIDRCFKRNVKDNVALVNGKPITRLEFEDEIANIPGPYRSQYQTEEGKEKLLDYLIERNLLLNEAERQNLAGDYEAIKRLADARMKILINFLLERERGKATVPEAEITKYYQEHLKEYTTPEQVRTREIVVKTEKEAQDLLKQLSKKGAAPFETLAVKKSIAPTAKNGGDMGLFSREQRSKEITDIIFALKKGTVSRVVPLEPKFAIFKLEDKTKREASGCWILLNTKEEAEKLLKEITAANFDSLAKKNSVDSETKEKGGNLGKFSLADKPKELRQVIALLKKGEISKSFKIYTQYALYRLEERKAQTVKALEQVKPQIQGTLLRQKQKEAQDNFISNLKSKADIKKFLKPEEEKPPTPVEEKKE